MSTQPCPCCSYPLLMHVRHAGVYWFCRHCWQEIPRAMIDPALRLHATVRPSTLINLSSSFAHP